MQSSQKKKFNNGEEINSKLKRYSYNKKLLKLQGTTNSLKEYLGFRIIEISLH